MKLKLNKKTKKRVKNVAKNYKMLKTSWGVQTKVFFENSTLHGVRYIAESDRPFIEKFMWFGCVAIGAVATTVIIVSLWEKFQTNPTITGLDTDFHNWEVPFPAITVCQEKPSNVSNIEQYLENYNGSNPDLMKNFLLDLTQLTLTSIPDFAKKYSDEKSLMSVGDSKGLVYGLMNKCEDVFAECIWKSYNYNCCDGFFPVFTEIGFCYTFNSRQYESQLPGSQGATKLPAFNMQYIKETDLKWSLKFGVQRNDLKIPIYILNSDEVAGTDVQPQHIWEFKVNRISFSVKQTYTTEDTKQLSIKQRHCAFANEIKLKIDGIYTYTACTRQCRMDTAMEKCNCVPYFYPTVHNYRHCTIKELQCIARNLEQIKSVDKCACRLGCFNTVYEVEKLNENSEEDEDKFVMETEFVSWPMVRYKREVLFGWVDLLVSFGGIAGLFLGFSLLSGVEILYYFTVRACCMVIREKRELEKIQFENASKTLPQYDLSLVPYFLAKPLPGNGINELVGKNYHRNLFKYNKIIPVEPRKKIKPADTIMPPFGIEYLN